MKRSHFYSGTSQLVSPREFCSPVRSLTTHPLLGMELPA